MTYMLLLDGALKLVEEIIITVVGTPENNSQKGIDAAIKIICILLNFNVTVLANSYM